MVTSASVHPRRVLRATENRIAPPLPVGRVCETGIRTHVMEFTPDDAKRILENVHPRQRKVSDGRVREYLRDMKVGAWHEPPFTFDSIAFDTEGRLCNGLHRMTALSLQDRSLRFLVVIGVLAPVDMPLPEGDGGIVRPKHFVAGRTKNEWAIVSYLAEHVYGSTFSRMDVDRLWAVFGDGVDAIPRFTTRAPRAPIRAGFVFQWAAANDAIHRQQLVEQWRAYCKIDVAQMWPSVAQLYRKMQSAGKGRTERHDQFARTMYALSNPEATQSRQDKDAASNVREWVQR